MEDSEWLVLIDRHGVVQAVDGGAPAAWLSQRLEDCHGVPGAVVAAARQMIRGGFSRGGALRRGRVAAASTGGAPVSVLVAEAIFLRPAPVDVAALVRRALEPLRPQAEAANLSLVIEPRDAVHEAVVDGAKVAWAVTALVGNALRYARAGKGSRRVEVHTAEHPATSMLSVIVEDDGPGIPANIQSRLVGSNPLGETVGVSLSLVHEIVTAHGGGMVIKSSTAKDDHGTTITLWLPLR